MALERYEFNDVKELWTKIIRKFNKRSDSNWKEFNSCKNERMQVRLVRYKGLRREIGRDIRRVKEEKHADDVIEIGELEAKYDSFGGDKKPKKCQQFVYE